MKRLLTAHWRRFLLVLLSSFGCVIAWLAHAAHTDSQGAVAEFCGRLGGSCDQTFDSPWAVFPPGSNPDAMEFSLPTSVFGLWHYGFLLFWFLFVGIPSYRRRWWHLIPLLEVSAAWAMVMLLLRVIFSEGLWCPFCIASHAITLLLGIGIYMTWPRDVADAPQSPPHPTHGLAVCAMVLGLALAIILWQGTVYPRLAQNAVLEQMRLQQTSVATLIEQHFEQEPVAIPVEEEDAVQSAASQVDPHTLVLFFDVQCPPCEMFLNELDETIAPLFDGRLTVVYKHFPLATTCNPETINIHPHACEAVLSPILICKSL